ncbi:MAG TPA: phosphopantetheine-binding protein [Streptosporangiaceae bacterium]|jgi:act minimal PKS acyl carrier protein|nr:phosphopantetheine-binding protein [Streptosporangiaceae bacterium]
MSAFTPQDLKTIMLSTADEDVAPDLDGDFLDQPFTGLSFDSLAVLEIAARIQQQYHLVISDEASARMTTPRDVLDYVNGQLRESA